jgi:hypothetical protein
VGARLARLGLTDLHFHDLRHAGNDLAAASGATLRELMTRMGHSTTRAALIYLHDSDDRQRKIAESLDAPCVSSSQGAAQPTGEAAVAANLARIWHKPVSKSRQPAPTVSFQEA